MKIFKKVALRPFLSFEVVAKYNRDLDEDSSYRHGTCYSSTGKDRTANN